MKLPNSSAGIISQVVESSEAKDHITWLLGQVQAVYPEEFDDVFVSETRDDEGRQIIRSVWLFNKCIALEIKSPTVGDSLSAVPFRSVRHVEVTMQNFDFRILRAEASSRVSVLIHFTDEIRGMLQASRVNCGHLMRITQQWLMPRLSI